jgi:hypothetical protein
VAARTARVIAGSRDGRLLWRSRIHLETSEDRTMPRNNARKVTRPRQYQRTTLLIRRSLQISTASAIVPARSRSNDEFAEATQEGITDA